MKEFDDAISYDKNVLNFYFFYDFFIQDIENKFKPFLTNFPKQPGEPLTIKNSKK